MRARVRSRSWRIGAGGTNEPRTRPCAPSWASQAASETSLLRPGRFFTCRALTSITSKLGVFEQVVVRSTRGALPVFPPVGFPEPPPAPGVPVSGHRALHKPRSGSLGPHPVAGQGEGMAAPRYR